jgi:hypothetical protein
MFLFTQDTKDITQVVENLSALLFAGIVIAMVIIIIKAVKAEMFSTKVVVTKFIIMVLLAVFVAAPSQIITFGNSLLNLLVQFTTYF